MNARKRMLSVTALSVYFLSVVSALAEVSSEAVVLEEITVTANKMEEDLQAVPQSITVINERDIEEQGLKSAMDVLDQIPNTLATANHGAGINFRGLNASMFTSNNPVVMYVDGVPIVNRWEYDFSLANVESVEVLRGPQGTLYGKDAIGAVVNVITRDPGETWEGKIKTEYGSWDTWQTSGYANGPIVADKLLMGISGQYDHTDGWVKNEYPGMVEDFGRKAGYDLNGYFLLTPTASLRLRLSVAHSYLQDHGETAAALPNGPELDDFDRDMLKHQRLDVDPGVSHQTDAQSLSISYDFDKLKLNSITTHRVRTLSDSIYDADFGDSPMFAGLTMFGDSELTTWSEELRLSSSNTSGLRWVGGIYLETEEDCVGPHYGQQFPNFDPETMAPLGNFEMVSDAKTDAKTGAIFGQVMVPLGPRFEMTLGGRYQRIEKEIHLEMRFQPVGMTLPPMQVLDLEKTWNAFLPKAAFSWFVTDNWTAYTSFSKGYMPGGFNFFSSDGGKEENAFEPQQSTNYEMGVKGEYDQFRVNAAAFYMDIKDIHIYKSEGTMYLTDNAEGAHSTGLELEGTWLPVRGLELTAALSVMDAEYDDFDLGNNVNLKGEHIEGAPDHGVRLSASYHHTCGFYSRADLRHIGHVHYYDGGAYTLRKADPYTVVNVRTGFLYKDMDIFAYVNNATDEAYINSLRANPIASVAGFGDERAFGVGVSYAF